MKRITSIKTYSKLIELPTFKERFEYLYIGGRVGEATFGVERYLNQNFYNSLQWRELRDEIILRDGACDLGIEGRDIMDRRYIRIHHIEPITMNDILNHSSRLMDPENLITCLSKTHQAIHYGSERMLPKLPIERRPNDTCPWR